MAVFARRYVEGRLSGFEKDMKICLTPTKIGTGSRVTHAYLPALAACCGILEYLTALHCGTTKGIGWQQGANFANHFLPSREYDREAVRILFDTFRNSIAHRGIASGVWIDRNRGAGRGRRITWRVSADAKRPACEVVEKSGRLMRDPPWPCPYTHLAHIHLVSLWVDIRKAAGLYKKAVGENPQFLQRFEACMRQLYPTVD